MNAVLNRLFLYEKVVVRSLLAVVAVCLLCYALKYAYKVGYVNALADVTQALEGQKTESRSI